MSGDAFPATMGFQCLEKSLLLTGSWASSIVSRFLACNACRMHMSESQFQTKEPLSVSAMVKEIEI